MITLTRDEIILCLSCCALIAKDLRREKRTIDYTSDGDDFEDIKALIEKLIVMRENASRPS